MDARAGSGYRLGDNPDTRKVGASCTDQVSRRSGVHARTTEHGSGYAGQSPSDAATVAVAIEYFDKRRLPCSEQARLAACRLVNGKRHGCHFEGVVIA